MPSTAPVVLDHGRLAVTLPGMPDRGVGQGGLVALMAVAFGAVAVGRLTGGPDVTPTGGVAGASGRPSVESHAAAATDRAATPRAASSGPTRTLVPSDVEPTPTGPASTPTATAAGATYTVQNGDTLSKIAAAHGTTWQELARLNKLKDPTKIKVGQVLQLP